MPLSGIDLTHAWTETPTVSDEWRHKSALDRLSIINLFIQFLRVNCISTTSDGAITLCFISPFSAAQRGALLLDLERLLQQAKISDNCSGKGLTVYLEAAADRNALRKLRGVTINA